MEDDEPSPFLVAAAKLSAIHTAAAAAGNPRAVLEERFVGKSHVLPVAFVDGCTALGVPIHPGALRAVFEALPFEADGLPRATLIDTILAAPISMDTPPAAAGSPATHATGAELSPPMPPAPAPAPAAPAAMAGLPPSGTSAWESMAPPDGNLSRVEQHQHWTRQSRPAPWATLDVSLAPMFEGETRRGAGALPSNRRPPSAAEAAAAALRAGKAPAGKPAASGGDRSSLDTRLGGDGKSTMDAILQARPASAPPPRRPLAPPPFALHEFVGALPATAASTTEGHHGKEDDVQHSSAAGGSFAMGAAPPPLPPPPPRAPLAAPYATLSSAEVRHLEELDERERRWRPSSASLGPTLWQPGGGGATVTGSRVVQMALAEGAREEAAGRAREEARDYLGVVPRTAQWVDGAAIRPDSRRGGGSCRPRTANGQISQISFG